MVHRFTALSGTPCQLAAVPRGLDVDDLIDVEGAPRATYGPATQFPNPALACSMSAGSSGIPEP
jgi:hypothetical protein